MLRLAENDRDGGIRIVEDPGDAVARLGRLDAEAPEFDTALAALGSDRLRQLARRVKAASKQARARERRSGQPLSRPVSPPSPRSAFFGD